MLQFQKTLKTFFSFPAQDMCRLHAGDKHILLIKVCSTGPRWHRQMFLMKWSAWSRFKGSRRLILFPRFRRQSSLDQFSCITLEVFAQTFVRDTIAVLMKWSANKKTANYPLATEAFAHTVIGSTYIKGMKRVFRSANLFLNISQSVK